MRVLNVNVLLDPILGGGTAERTFQMSNALAKSGIECAILTTDVGLTESRINALEGVSVIALHSIFKRYFIVSFSIRKLIKLIESVDIVHLMGHWSMLNVLVFLITRMTKTPYVICPAGELNLFGRSKPIKKIFNTLIGNRIVKNASGYIAVTPDEISTYRLYGVKSESITIIPNGVNNLSEEFSNKVSQRTDDFNFGSPYILFMGRLNEIKGPDLLLEAFSLIAEDYPSYHLVFAGPDGGMLNTLKQYSEKRLLDSRVHFIGYVGGVDKQRVYQQADFLVIPSRSDAMSIVVLEAGVCGTPVLITETCGFNEVANVDGGVVVKPNVDDLKNGLQEMLNQPDNLCSMGERLKYFVESNYAWNIISQRYLDLYTKILINCRESNSH